MKKRLTTLLSTTLLCITLCSCGATTSSPIEDFTYEFKDGTVTITGYTGSDLDIIIPSKIENRPVTTIGESAFIRYDMNSIYFPNSITTIKANAFNDCALLNKVTFEEGLTNVESYAFTHCKSLNDVILPDSIRYLSSSAFNGSGWYENQPEGPLYSGNVLVGYKGDPIKHSTSKDHTVEIFVKDGTKVITDNALNYSAIRYIHIPESVIHIGNNAIMKEEFRELVTLYGKEGSIVETYAFENYAKFVAE